VDGVETVLTTHSLAETTPYGRSRAAEPRASGGTLTGNASIDGAIVEEGIPMSAEDDLLGLERAAWDALSSDGDAAARFYDAVLAREVLMLLPGGMVLDDRTEVIDSMRGSPWTSYELSDERVLVLSEGSAVVAYRATAQRDGGAYTALFNSTYVRVDGGWRLAVHQQTPV
jgi:hypothetical protein